MYQKAVNGSSAEDALYESSQNVAAADWSVDGRFILFSSTSRQTGPDISALPLFGDRKPFAVANSSFDERQGQFSPNGRWIAYQSNESQRIEIYVQQFMSPNGKSLVSTGGGVQPRWRKDGKELFYVSLDGKLMATPIQFVSGGDAIDVGKPSVLFAPPLAGGPLSTGGNQQYAVSPDGQRFLVNATVEEQATTPITLILNWKPPA